VGTAIGGILGNAVGVAISPVPVIAVILMLFSATALRNGTAFVAGWLVGLAVVLAVVLALGGLGSSGSTSTVAGVVKIVVGVLFLLLALRQWRSRPAPGQEATMPPWMASIDAFGVGKAFGIGALLSGVNPKNLGLTLAAGSSIAASGLATGQQAAVGAVYVVIASVTVAAPVLLFLVARDRATTVLERAKEWLTANNAVVMVVLFTVLGAKVLGDGITSLAA
jgi:threonine/homoserine/homoserine lactone efflux protein